MSLMNMKCCGIIYGTAKELASHLRSKEKHFIHNKKELDKHVK